MSISSRETIVIVGYGWVGQANSLALSIAGYDVSYFDVNQPKLHYTDKYQSFYDNVKKLSSVLENDSPNTWYLVCVGDKVSLDGEQDISAIRKALDSLKDAKGGVILRSTIVPGHLSSLHFNYYVPEFLHEKMAIEESIKPHYFILGVRNEGKGRPSFFKAWESATSKYFEGSPEDASYVKYLSNTWNSLRIAFVNEFGNAISDPTDLKQVARIEKIMDFLFERKAYLRYGRSYGGHCLPKDTRAFYKWHKDNGKNMSLIGGMCESNIFHQKIEEKNPHLKEWFSEWVRPEPSGRAALRALFLSIVRNLKKIFN